MSSSRSERKSSPPRTGDQERLKNDAGARQAEGGVAGTNDPVPKQDGQPEPKKPGSMTLTKFNVEGNTILTQDKIDAVLAKYTGAVFQFKDVDQARGELEKAYHEAGYPTVLVNLPEQTIEQGSVTLQVIEAPLIEINVTGQQHHSKYRILEKMPSLQIGTVLYEPTFAKELSAINANPDLQVAPVLKPGTEPGTVNLELKVKDRLPVHGKLEADNRGPITTPQNRLVAEVQHTNLFGGDEILTLTTVQTPTDLGAVQNYGASFIYPVKWPDHLLTVYASKAISQSVLAGALIPVGGGGNVLVAGNATIAGFRYTFPLFPGSENTHQLSAGVDYKRLDRTEATFPGGGTAVVLSPVQYTPASVAYTGFYPDRWGLTKLALSAKGYVAGTIPGGAKEDFSGDPNDPILLPGLRQGSTGTFAVLQGGLDRVQPLPENFALTLHTDGQWGTQPLIPAEQYFAGGFDTVRGYLQYEAIADHGIRGRAELTTPELLTIPIDRIWQRRRSADYTVRVKFAAFYDAAQLWVQQPVPGQISQFRLEGVGGGIRVKFPKDVGLLIIDQGVALHDTPNTKQGDTFVHFSVGLMF
ncbi:MAG: BamA/TamA family outer membrane protein [Nitrospira sp.]|nr:BamA/TamA family outer membrane protein [Nitrospira sp.]